MPSSLLQQGAMVICAHGGQAQPTAVNSRVTVSGQATVTVNAPYTVSGCVFPPPPNGNGPCATANWIPVSGTTRVLSNGQPLLLSSSQAICATPGTPLIVGLTQ